MRKYFLNTLPLVTAAVVACGITSCSSDDDDNGGSTPQGPTATYGGNLLQRTGNMNFIYDDKGRCIEVRLDDVRDGLMFIDYDKHTMTMEDEVYNVRFNSSGCITELSASVSEREDGYTWKMDGRVTFNYDSNGHLTGGTSTATGTVSGNGERYTESESASAKYTWSGNLLTKVYCEEESKEDGEVTNSETTTYEITYSDTDNKYCQWTHAAESYYMAGDCMGFAGMFGKASAKLVASYTESEIDNGQENRPTTTNVTYTLNSDGTIRTEKVGYSTYTYTYLSYGNNDESDEAKSHSLSRAANGTDAMAKSIKKLLNLTDMQNRLKERMSRK